MRLIQNLVIKLSKRLITWNTGAHKNRIILSFCLVASGLVLGPPAQANSHSMFSHLHDVRVFGNQILLGTHEGLFEYVNKDTFVQIGKDRPDVMGLSIAGKKIYASGHPAAGSKAVNPVGLIVSNDMGKSWQDISLRGKADFHFLEVANGQVYGANASSGELLYSANLGKSWKSLGTNLYSDIAIDPKVKGSALALKEGQLYFSDNSLKSVKELLKAPKLTVLDWNKNGVLGASGKDLLRSLDKGKTWITVKTFASAIMSISQSESLIAVISGNAVQISKDNGKTFKQ